MREPPPEKSDVILLTLLSLFACAWLSVAAVGTAADFSNALRQYRAARFPTTIGRVMRSSVQKKLHDNKNKDQPPIAFYWPEIHYQYQVQGKPYRGSRYRYQRSRSDSDPRPANAVVAAFPEGSDVTVFYNPRQSEDAVLKPGIVGHDLLLFPGFAFAAVGLIAVRFIGGWWRDNFIRSDTGGVRILSDGTRVRARLPRYSPLMLGLLTAVLLSLATMIEIGESFARPASLRDVGIGWAVVLAGAGSVFGGRWGRLVSGVEDLVIDREAGTITLPRNFGRWRTITVGISGVVSAKLLESGEGRRYRCFPTLFFSDAELKPARLGDWMEQRKGRAFIGWLREQIWP